MDFIKKISFYLVVAALMFGAFLIIKNTGNNTETESLINEVDKTDKSVNIDKELASISKRPSWYNDQFRKLLSKHKSEINKFNCKGLLYEKEKGKFIKKVFGFEFGDKDEFVLHYNFCGFTYDQEEILSLIFTTKTLINKIDYLGDDGRKYVPSIMYKTNNKGVVLSEDRAYIAKEDILSY